MDRRLARWYGTWSGAGGASSSLWRSSTRESEYTLLGPGGRDCEEDASENRSSAKVAGELESIVDETMDEATVDGNATLSPNASDPSWNVMLDATEMEIGADENRLVSMPADD